MIALNASIADCFHEGHSNLYGAMQQAGEKVIVILHDDLSCYKIKNKIPIQTLEHRTRNLLLTGLVDKVIPTYATDPAYEFEQVIKEYGAENVEYFRGDDLTDFPGKWMLDKYGVKINYLPYTEGVSSTKIRDLLCR